MTDNNIIKEFNDFFSEDLSKEFLFSIDTYLLFLDKLSIDRLDFFRKWSDISRQNKIDKYWMPNTKLDWKWSLSLPLFSLLEKYIENFNNPKIIGFSGLPGSGKSTLGFWIDNLARDLSLDIKVISLDDFYLPSTEMDNAVNGNPWNVPRGFPGSHSVDLMNLTLDTFLETGFLKTPIFEKSLRDGKGDRSGWCETTPKVLILEGWFVGCEPISNLIEIDHLSDDEFNLCLSNREKEFRKTIQKSLIRYSKIWRKFDKIWHLKSSDFNNIILWKTQQEQEMIKSKGSGLKDKRLTDFIRMIQASIPQQSLSSINADTTVEINQLRRIKDLYSNTYLFQ